MTAVQSSCADIRPGKLVVSHQPYARFTCGRAVIIHYLLLANARQIYGAIQPLINLVSLPLYRAVAEFKGDCNFEGASTASNYGTASELVFPFPFPFPSFQVLPLPPARPGQEINFVWLKIVPGRRRCL